MGLGKTIQVRCCLVSTHCIQCLLLCALFAGSAVSGPAAPFHRLALIIAKAMTVPALHALLWCQVIALVCHLAGELQERRPFLIAVPSSVLPNWEAELQRWAPGLKVSAAWLVGGSA